LFTNPQFIARENKKKSDAEAATAAAEEAKRAKSNTRQVLLRLLKQLQRKIR
jgi:hypothetical protein